MGRWWPIVGHCLTRSSYIAAHPQLTDIPTSHCGSADIPHSEFRTPHFLHSCGFIRQSCAQSCGPKTAKTAGFLQSCGFFKKSRDFDLDKNRFQSPTGGRRGPECPPVPTRRASGLAGSTTGPSNVIPNEYVTYSLENRSPNVLCPYLSPVAARLSLAPCAYRLGLLS